VSDKGTVIELAVPKQTHVHEKQVSPHNHSGHVSPHDHSGHHHVHGNAKEVARQVEMDKIVKTRLDEIFAAHRLKIEISKEIDLLTTGKNTQWASDLKPGAYHTKFFGSEEEFGVERSLFSKNQKSRDYLSRRILNEKSNKKLLKLIMLLNLAQIFLCTADSQIRWTWRYQEAEGIIYSAKVIRLVLSVLRTANLIIALSVVSVSYLYARTYNALFTHESPIF